MNHRIFERTLRPSVFRGACLFERHYTIQAWLGIGPSPLRRARKAVAVRRDFKRSKYQSRFESLRRGLPGNPTEIVYSLFVLPIIDLGSGRDTR